MSKAKSKASSSKVTLLPSKSTKLERVASLQKGGGKQHTKVIKMVKSPKSGSYTFKEEIVHNDRVKDWF